MSALSTSFLYEDRLVTVNKHTRRYVAMIPARRSTWQVITSSEDRNTATNRARRFVKNSDVIVSSRFPLRIIDLERECSGWRLP